MCNTAAIPVTPGEEAMEAPAGARPGLPRSEALAAELLRTVPVGLGDLGGRCTGKGSIEAWCVNRDSELGLGLHPHLLCAPKQDCACVFMWMVGVPPSFSLCARSSHPRVGRLPSKHSLTYTSQTQNSSAACTGCRRAVLRPRC